MTGKTTLVQPALSAVEYATVADGNLSDLVEFVSACPSGAQAMRKPITTDKEQMMTTTSPVNASEIHASVQQYYGERARTASNCCGPADESCCGSFYSVEELTGLPTEAVSGSLGCGNPTAWASLRPGETAVDLGSGGGIDVFMAARNVGDDGFVYGIDMTDDMLALARANARKMGVTNVEFRKGQIEHIPLADRTADVIISNCVINLSPDKQQTLADAYRVLKPGGRIAVSDIVIDGVLDDLPVTEAQVRSALNWTGCIAGALTITQFTRLLEEAGFEQIEIDIKHRYRLEDLGQNMESVKATLSPEVASELVQRFTSCNISARRPQE